MIGEYFTTSQRKWINFFLVEILATISLAFGWIPSDAWERVTIANVAVFGTANAAEKFAPAVAALKNKKGE